MPSRTRTRIFWAAGAALFIVATVAGFAAVTASPAPPPQATATPTAPPTPAPTVAFLGDSYTVGIGADVPTHGYATLFAADLSATPINFGISGTGYVSPASASPFGNRVAQVLAAHPSIVIVQGSVNDSTNPAFAPRIQGAATSVLQSLKAGLPDARIVVVGPAPTPAMPATQIGPDAAAVKSAAATGLPFIDTTGMLDPADLSLWAPDGIHPNTAGHAKLAGELLTAYRALRQ